MICCKVLTHKCRYISRTPLSTDAPAPLPRPATTMTKRSILIRNRGQNGHVDQQETSAADLNRAAAGAYSALDWVSCVHVTVVLFSDAPGLSHQASVKERDGYAFASEATSAQVEKLLICFKLLLRDSLR